MLSRLSAFVIWALVAATVVFWGLRLLVRAPTVPATAVAVGDAAAVRVDLTRLLGAAPAATAAPAAQAVEASSRFRLLGIMAPKPSAGPGHAHGVALIAIDGKLPKAYQVGASLDGELVLQSVSLRSAVIGPAQGAPIVTLELPQLPVAATGTLPAPGVAFAPGGMVAAVPPRNSAPMPTGPMSVPQAIPPGLPQPRDPGAPTQ
jgi:general secretion pathway protein C